MGELANPKDLTERASPLKNKSIRNEIRWFSEAKAADAFLGLYAVNKNRPEVLRLQGV